MSQMAVNIKDLTKSYATSPAVSNVSLTINEGELFGLIGPDGAGKTTTIRTLCGLLSFDSGSCSLFGFDVVKQIKEIRKIIGYMPQRFSLYPDLTVAENLRFFADLFNISEKEREERLERLLQFSKLAPFQKRRANDLSGGMKQKLALSCTLIHTPKILILDEPTTGVDPVSRREFWDILKDLQKEGVTILVSTPYMDEAGLCDRVAFMHLGQIMATDKPDNFKNYFSHELLEIKSPNIYTTLHHLKENPLFLSTQLFGDRIHITVENAEDAQNELKKTSTDISSITRIDPGIEDVFIELMQTRDNNETNISTGN